MTESVNNQINKVKATDISDFDYPLPDSRIPRHPLPVRDECRLLLSAPSGKIFHRKFKELPCLLPPGTLLACNDTKVINARLEFHKATGARIEIFLLEPSWPADYALSFQSRETCRWICLVGNLKKWKDEPLKMNLPNSPQIVLEARLMDSSSENGFEIEFRWNGDITFAEVIEAAGNIPIPPYLNRKSEESDLSDYQTVYADAKGSVAAPTAGLHFTPGVFESLEAHNIPVEKLTLHVGAGTFRPVKANAIGDHPMHTETFMVSRRLLHSLIDRKRRNQPIAAVGTTTVRTLESLPYLAAEYCTNRNTHVSQWMAYEERFRDADTLEMLESLLREMDRENADILTASTAIMIAPGFHWRITDIMITNFHQPKSTLLLLVSSFLDRGDNGLQWRKIYEEALAGDYRFLSYGDACLLFPLNS